VLAGVTWRPASDFIVGALAGYESFNYSSDLLTGQLDGNGWTVGGYLGWRLAPGQELYVAVDNVADAKISTGKTADFVDSFSEPRTFRVGFSYRR